MATYNPAMLKGDAYGKDWKAAPDLTSFAADYAGASASGGGVYGASATTGAAGSASVSDVGISASAGAASAGNGAGTSLPLNTYQE